MHVNQRNNTKLRVLDIYAFSGSELINNITVNFGDVKTAPTGCKEKCFQMMSPAYLHYIVKHLNVEDSSKRSGR